MKSVSLLATRYSCLIKGDYSLHMTFLLNRLLFKRYTLFTLLLLFLRVYDSPAQRPAWGKTMSSKAPDICNEVRVSPSGKEIFVFGNFGDSLSVGNQILVPQSNQSPFIIKYDTSGTVLWYSQVKGSEVTLENAAVATNGDIIIEGRFSERIDFGNEVYLNESVNASAFVARMTNSGDPLWIKIFADSGYGDIALSENGHVYFVHGIFPEGAIAPTDSWIRHLGTAGDVIWETKFISSVYPTVTYPQSLTVNNGQVILGCAFNGDIAIANTVLSARDGLGFFVVRFNTEGQLKWVKNLGVSTYSNACISDLMANYDGGFYLSGALPNQTMLARYDSVGTMLWQKRTAGDSFGISYLSQSAEGRIFFAADFYNSPQFEGYQLRGTNDSQVILNAPNIVVGELSSSGVLRSLKQFEPSSLNSVTAVALGSKNDFYVSGYSHALTLRIEDLALPMKNSDPFSSGDGFLVKLVFNNNMIFDPFITKLDLGADVLLCKNESFILEPKGFVHYTWQDNSTSSTFIVTKPGVYSLLAIDQFGNESRDTIRVSACEKPEVFIPDVITPNDDASNDFFRITGIDTTLNNTLTIYNRWGEVVYHENSYQGNWNASSLSSGVYFYLFYDEATDQKYKGSLHVVK